MDEAAEWAEWAEEVELAMSALTGPDAPHSFRICRRRQVGIDFAQTSPDECAAEIAACHRADHRGFQPNGEDVVMVVKARMASQEVAQIILMVPFADLSRYHRLASQPQGTHSRRPASDADRKKVNDHALAAYQAGAIRKKACDYLTQWSRGALRRQPRPSQYRFLSHRVQSWIGPNMRTLDLPAPSQNARPVIVEAVGSRGSRRQLPVLADGDEDADVGPLIID